MHFTNSLEGTYSENLLVKSTMSLQVPLHLHPGLPNKIHNYIAITVMRCCALSHSFSRVGGIGEGLQVDFHNIGVSSTYTNFPMFRD